MPRPTPLHSAAPYPELIEQIYSAALDPGLWPAFLEPLADAIGGAGCAFVSADPKNPKGSLDVSVRVDPEVGQVYSDHFAAIEPWPTKGRTSVLMQAGVALPSLTVVPHNDFVKDRILQRLRAPVRHGAWGVRNHLRRRTECGGHQHLCTGV